VLTWVRNACRFKQDVVKCTLLLHEVLNGLDTTVFDAAAEATVWKFEVFLSKFAWSASRVGEADRFRCDSVSLSKIG